jgi:predicted DNA-binding transcriptional regulator YafY
MSDTLMKLPETGFTLPELCALYLGRTMIERLPGVPFQEPMRDAFSKFETELPPHMKKFLDRLPSVIAAKPDPGKRQRPADPDILNRLLQASVEHRQVRMRYH